MSNVISLQDYKNTKAKSHLAKAFKLASECDDRIQRIKASIERINTLLSQAWKDKE